MAVKSPCIDVCRFDGKTDLCRGCLRTRTEVVEWKKMSDHQRRDVLGKRQKREKKLAKK